MILNNCTLERNFIDLIVNALAAQNGLKIISLRNSNVNGDQVKSLMSSFGTKEKSNQFCHIEVMDLANNNFGYSGIEAISETLKFNKTLKILNLFHNVFDVNGARRLSEALEVNKTLEALNIGYNRIKDLGLDTIVESLIKNKDSALRFLGCRYNFIKSKSFSKLIDSVINDSIKLSQIEMTNNCIEEKVLAYYFEKYFDSNTS